MEYITNDLLLMALIFTAVALVVAVTFLFTKKFALKKMNRVVMKAEHNYQQQIASLQQQLSSKITMLETVVNKLTLSNSELNRLNEIKSKFLSVVAHDLRQPLSSIQGFTSVLMMDGAAGGGVGDQQALNNILKATDNMNLLMADLMDISMIEAGKFNMYFKEFAYEGLINDVFSLQYVNAQKKGISFFRYDYPSDLPVTADRFRLSQVLNNLIGNAIKFTPQGGKVELRYQLEGDTIKTFITDNGPGIPHYEKMKIFQKFHQSESTERKLKRQGWGLGLSITQEIVAAHNGMIGVDSAGVGHGSTFWFSIPLTQANPEA
ncbi:two-component system [Parelusimicrobium proximum]|uniref:sensor histidine kinase n=1 Tax=Parelusimicrobium proximum TaxID=3228953 RepID=UPI003D1706CA